MPELPEVEALKDFLGSHLTGHEIVRVLPVAVSVLKTYDPPVTALEGRTVAAVHRHGKFLDLDLDADGPHLVVHLARAGWLQWRENLPDGLPRRGKGPLALRIALETGAGIDLTEAGTQKRLAVYVVRDTAEVPGIARLGPDPLAADFDARRLAVLLADQRRQIKGALRDQTLIAGIGNAYSDEILHAARMSPYKRAAQLSAGEVDGLYEAMRSTLDAAVQRARQVDVGRLKAEKKSSLRVHGRAGQPCAVCGDTVRQVSFSDSALQYCPTCQTGGRILADRRMSRLLK
jgi:formamidopyrimidine-DNA glycosylase